MGARVIAAASSAREARDVQARGRRSDAIDYAREDLKERVKALTNGAGADVVYDPVGGKYSEAALRATAWNGRLLVIGFAAGEIPKIPLNLTLLKGASIIGVFWGQFTMREPARALRAVHAAVRVGARRQARAARARDAAARRSAGGDAHAPRPQGAGQDRLGDVDGDAARHRTRARAHQGRHLHVAVRALGDVLEAHRQQGLLQAREPADDRLLQGARRAQQDPHAHATRRKRAASSRRRPAITRRASPTTPTRKGIAATIVMPAATPLIKVTRTREYGAEVVLHGASYDEAFEEAWRRREARGAHLHPRLRRRRGHGGAGHRRARAARAESVPRGGDGAHRRRRAHQRHRGAR